MESTISKDVCCTVCMLLAGAPCNTALYGHGPGAIVRGCRPESEPAQWSVDDKCVKWPECDSCRLSHSCDRALHWDSLSYPLLVDQHGRLAADWMMSLMTSLGWATSAACCQW